MARGFSKPEIARLGFKYAVVLLYDPFIRPEAMPDLAKHPDWLEKGETMRHRAVQDIKGVAKKLFSEAGYSQATIQRVLG